MSFDGEVLHDLGHIVKGLDSSDIMEIPSNVVEENMHVFAEADLQPEEAVAVVEKTESARRKRRAVGRQRVKADFHSVQFCDRFLLKCRQSAMSNQIRST